MYVPDFQILHLIYLRFLWGEPVTAEIAIMNKAGIALAADSAVTIGSGNGKKVYNSVNKLFTLSKYHPVGILIYGSAEFTTLPWESIIKEFRNHAGKTDYDHLRGYVDAFLEYLRKQLPIGDEEEAANVGNLAVQFFGNIRNNLVKQCRDRHIVLTNVKLRGEPLKILRKVISDRSENLKKVDQAPSLNGLKPAAVAAQYDSILKAALEHTFEPYQLPDPQIKSLVKVVSVWLCKELYSSGHSGFAIAGYGEKEYYPSLYSFVTDGKVMGDCKIMEQSSHAVTYDNVAFIRPFAQSDMAESFMEGIDKDHGEVVDRVMETLFMSVPNLASKHFRSATVAQKTKFEKGIQAGLQRAKDVLARYRQANYVDPVMDAVRFLDKQELAALAESLVSLTAMKRKISLDAETVGGPVDVAVISKNDGFIWIKRKHYFRPEINPFFFQNYLQS